MLLLFVVVVVVVVVVVEEHTEELNVITALFWVTMQRVLVISYRRLQDSLSVLEDRTNRLSRNVDKKIPLLTAL